MNTPKTVILKLVCAIGLAGEVLRAGTLVEVTTSEAKDLLRRGKAVVVHEDDIEDDAHVVQSGGTDTGLHPDLSAYNDDQEAARATATINLSHDSLESASAKIAQAIAAVDELHTDTEDDKGNAYSVQGVDGTFATAAAAETAAQAVDVRTPEAAKAPPTHRRGARTHKAGTA